MAVLCFVAISGFLRCARADAPATQAADPRDAFKSFLFDLSQGKPNELGNLCVARDRDAIGLLHDFQAVASAMSSLRAAVGRKFGASAVDSVSPHLPSADDVDDMSETRSGDKATLAGESVTSIELVRSDDGWKIDLDWLSHSADMPANRHWYAEMAQVIRRTAADVAGGRLDSPQAATEALLARQNAIPEDGATTEPTTQP